MSFFSSLFHHSSKTIRQGLVSRILRLLQTNFLMLGVSALGLLLLTVLFFSGYAFYKNVAHVRPPVTPHVRKISLSDESFAKVKILLDARRDKFDAALHGTFPRLPESASSTAVAP